MLALVHEPKEKILIWLGLVSSAIFYLPDVINNMPDYTPERVAGIPAAGHQGFASGWLAKYHSDRFSHALESGEVMHLERLVAHTDLTCVRPFDFDDVAVYLVAVATTAARSLAQVFWRACDDLIQQLPRSTQERQ